MNSLPNPSPTMATLIFSWLMLFSFLREFPLREPERWRESPGGVFNLCGGDPIAQSQIGLRPCAIPYLSPLRSLSMSW